jgi:hypothetical protein
LRVFHFAASRLVALVLSHSGHIRPALLLVLLGITYVVMHAAARHMNFQGKMPRLAFD